MQVGCRFVVASLLFRWRFVGAAMAGKQRRRAQAPNTLLKSRARVNQSAKAVIVGLSGESISAENFTCFKCTNDHIRDQVGNYSGTVGAAHVSERVSSTARGIFGFVCGGCHRM